MQIPFYDRLEKSRGVLVTGCGGGLDFLGGIPILSWLARRGIPAVLGNVSFTQLARSCHERIGPLGWVVDETCSEGSRFTERALWPWLAEQGLTTAFVGFQTGGVVPMRASFEAVAGRYGLDTVVLIDGGLDSLLKGDEAELATIEEDAVSVVAASLSAIPTKLLACIGFGVDSYHGGMCHRAFLENVAEATRRGGYLGSVSATAGSREGDALLQAMDRISAALPDHGSAVGPSIAAGMRGEFGDRHPTGKPKEGAIFVSPLLPIYWTFSVETVAAMMGFAEGLAGTKTLEDAERVIRLHGHGGVHRTSRRLPW